MGSIVHVKVTGDGPTLPAASVARTSKVCVPAASAAYDLGLVQAPNPPPSS